MSELFTDDEDEVLRLILRRMGKEMRPRELRRDSLKAYERKVDFAIDRTMAWLESLNKQNEQSFSSNGAGELESGKPDSADEFRTG